MRKRVIKKWLFLTLFCMTGALLLGGGYMLWRHPQRMYRLLNEEESEPTPVWMAATPPPKTIKPGAYLAALNAVFNDDLEKAAAYYLQVLSGDSDNMQLQREAYFFNAILGKFDELRFVIDKIAMQKAPEFLTEYVQAGYAIREAKWAEVRQNFKNQGNLSLNRAIKPLITAWTWAAEGNLNAAKESLEPLKKEKGFNSYYYYHLGLMGMMLGDEQLADASFQGLAQEKLPTFSFYPEIRAFYTRKDQWNLDNPFYVQWQQFNSDQPATAELAMQSPVRAITAIRGIAEVFYNVSTAIGISKSNYEGALILSALSLYLNPNQELPKIWNAEILEQVKKPQLASHYYAQLSSQKTQTLAFKQAMNLMACGRDKEALDILIQLKKTNQGSTPLWLALASIYQGQKDWDAALQAYTHILNIEGESNRTYASDIYFARAFIYGERQQNKLAEKDLQRALELNPENPMILNHLGYQWLETNRNLEKGFELVEKAYKLKSSDPHIIDSMAFAYYKKAQYSKALPLAEKTVDKMPQSSVANAHLGDIYLALGRRREALFQYQKALALKYDLTPELKQELDRKITQNTFVKRK